MRCRRTFERAGARSALRPCHGAPVCPLRLPPLRSGRATGSGECSGAPRGSAKARRLWAEEWGWASEALTTKTQNRVPKTQRPAGRVVLSTRVCVKEYEQESNLFLTAFGLPWNLIPAVCCHGLLPYWDPGISPTPIHQAQQGLSHCQHFSAQLVDGCLSSAPARCGPTSPQTRQQLPNDAREVKTPQRPPNIKCQSMEVPKLQKKCMTTPNKSPYLLLVNLPPNLPKITPPVP